MSVKWLVTLLNYVSQLNTYIYQLFFQWIKIIQQSPVRSGFPKFPSHFDFVKTKTNEIITIMVYDVVRIKKWNILILFLPIISLHTFPQITNSNVWFGRARNFPSPVNISSLYTFDRNSTFVRILKILLVLIVVHV